MWLDKYFIHSLTKRIPLFLDLELQELCLNINWLTGFWFTRSNRQYICQPQTTREQACGYKFSGVILRLYPELWLNSTYPPAILQGGQNALYTHCSCGTLHGIPESQCHTSISGPAIPFTLCPYLSACRYMAI